MDVVDGLGERTLLAVQPSALGELGVEGVDLGCH